MAKMSGVEAVLAGLKNAEAQYKKAVIGAIYQEASVIMKLSLIQVPVDTGRLRASHYIQKPEVWREDPIVKLGYNTDYALAVHERTDVDHTKVKTKKIKKNKADPRSRFEADYDVDVDRSQKAKYLEDPFNARKPGMTERIIERTKALFLNSTGSELTMPDESEK